MNTATAPTAPTTEKLFSWTATDTGSDVLGGPVPRGSAYFQMISEVTSGPQPDDLEVGQQCWVTMRASGETGRYILTRVA